MTPAITILAAETELPEPVAAGWQLVLRPGRHRAHRRADYHHHTASVPRADLRALTVGQTIKSWSIMQTVLSVTGLVFVLLLGIVI